MSEDSSPIIITQPEFIRRMLEQQKLGGGGGFYGAFPEMFTMTINSNHAAITGLTGKPEKKQQATIKQLTDLSHDLKNGSVEDEEAIEFLSEEKREADKIIEELKTNTELMRFSLETFSKSLPIAQETVKKLNGGSLPTLIQPEIKKKPKKH